MQKTGQVISKEAAAAGRGTTKIVKRGERPAEQLTGGEIRGRRARKKKKGKKQE